MLQNENLLKGFDPDHLATLKPKLGEEAGITEAGRRELDEARSIGLW